MLQGLPLTLGLLFILVIGLLYTILREPEN